MDITDVYTVICLLTAAAKSREVTLNIREPPFVFFFFFFFNCISKIHFTILGKV